MTALRTLRAAAFGILLALALPSAAMQQAFLIQNSGWMEPFYADPASQFKPLVAALVQTVTSEQDHVVISVFNQQAPGNPSPVVLYQGRGPGAPASALAPLGVARKSRTALADTDFKEAVLATITGPFKAEPGILWIVTNNRNSPNNDSQTAERNREFYQLVHLEPSVSRALAYPLRMPVQGQHYQATGLMVYALAYGEPAALHLDALVEQGRIAQVFTNPPARLKPLDRESVRIVPREVRNSDNVQVSLGADGQTLVFDVAASALSPEIVLRASIENQFFPYRIEKADIQAGWNAAGQSMPVPVTPARLSGLAPGSAAGVELRLPVPAAEIPSTWSWAAIAALGKQLILPGTVELALVNQSLRVSDEFVASLARLFPNDPLSEVFTPPDAVTGSTVRLPVLLRIQYPLTPVIALVAGVILLALLLLALAALAQRPSRYEVSLDGVKRTVIVKPFSAVELRGQDGQLAGRIRRSLGRPRVVETAAGHTLQVLGASR